ncbi:MAG: hypothetical protein RLZZ66_1279 [Pseudomonadota bacterium]|jgi:hypothetical protein
MKDKSLITATYIDSNVMSLIKNVDSSIGKQDETLLALGDKLAEIKLQVALDNNNDDRKTKNIFNAIKKETASKLKSTDITTINKLVKITTNSKITQYRRENKIPNRWGTLTLLTSLDDSRIEDLVASGEINNSITRAELKRIVDGKRQIIKIPKASLVIINEDKQSVNDDDISLLNELLIDFGWQVKKQLRG